MKKKKTKANTVHIAGRGSVVRQLRILVSQFRVLRTGTLFEIRPDNMYQPLTSIIKETKNGTNLNNNNFSSPSISISY